MFGGRAALAMALMGFGLLVAGCHGPPGPRYAGERLTPRGQHPARWVVWCRDSLAYCGEAAQRACPAGWQIVTGADQSTEGVKARTYRIGDHQFTRARVTRSAAWEWIVQCER